VGGNLVMAEALSFRVMNAMPEDVGRGHVRIDNEDMDKMMAALGDVVEIQGSKTTVAKVVPCFSEFKKQNVILMEAIIRENAGVGIDERVTLRKVAWRPAQTIVLSPLDVSIDFNEADDLKHLERILCGMVKITGDCVKIDFAAAKSQYFTVIGTAPQGPVVINTLTTIKVTKPDASEDRSFQASYEDVGGLDKELKRVRELVELPLKYPELFRGLGVDAPKGILLYGSPGTGKTLLARAVASETVATFIHVNGPEIVNKFYGESEARLREIFETAQRRAPAIIFIDEIDAIAPKRADVIGDVEKRIVAQLLALMDGLKNRGQVIVIGATNVPDMVDLALRRPGRFDRELSINPPDQSGRLTILKIHTRKLSTDDSIDLGSLAQLTPGFVGADLAVLCKEAGMNAVRRLLPQIDLACLENEEYSSQLKITMDDFNNALREVEPSATREYFSERPNTKWEEVGGLSSIKERLRYIVDLPLQHADLLKQTGFRMPKGILLTGRPGTGKTLLVRALAGSSGVHFISINSAMLNYRWLGEAEKGLRQIFKRAKQIAPCILFFDEIDAMASIRVSGDVLGSDRLVSQLLLEIDNMINITDVILVAATNRPDKVDPAFMRAGRFDFILELPLPNHQERLAIFEIYTARIPIAKDIDFNDMAKSTDGMTGSDIEGICKHATMVALKRLTSQLGSKSYDLSSFLVLSQDFTDGFDQIALK
jgi:transitional endoplasmic reticulum ATPase